MVSFAVLYILFYAFKKLFREAVHRVSTRLPKSSIRTLKPFSHSTDKETWPRKKESSFDGPIIGQKETQAWNHTTSNLDGALWVVLSCLALHPKSKNWDTLSLKVQPVVKWTLRLCINMNTEACSLSRDGEDFTMRPIHCRILAYPRFHHRCLAHMEQWNYVSFSWLAQNREARSCFLPITPRASYAPATTK